MKTSSEDLKNILALAGITINGEQPWDITMHDPVVSERILSQGSLGLGETYMDGQWDCPALDQMFDRLLRIEHIEKKMSKRALLRLTIRGGLHRLRNLQSLKRAFQVGEQHYDIGNDLFEAILDPTMSYSCAYWENAETLEQAQLNKLEMICRKLELKKGEKILDLGCGWGSFAKYAAKQHGVEVVGITVSKEQQILAQKRCQGLPIEIKLMDYRNLQGKFDKVASIAMFEAVGLKNYRAYFKKISDLLNDQGLFLLHTIGTSKRVSAAPDPWINKYIFPNGKLPSVTDIAKVSNGFILEDWHNFGLDYDRTLMVWAERFDRSWDTLKNQYNERFYRMWKYYLLFCAVFFRSRRGQLWQIVFSKPARRQEYRSKRVSPHRDSHS